MFGGQAVWGLRGRGPFGEAFPGRSWWSGERPFHARGRIGRRQWAFRLSAVLPGCSAKVRDQGFGTLGSIDLSFQDYGEFWMAVGRIRVGCEGGGLCPVGLSRHCEGPAPRGFWGFEGAAGGIVLAPVLLRKIRPPKHRPVSAVPKFGAFGFRNILGSQLGLAAGKGSGAKVSPRANSGGGRLLLPSGGVQRKKGARGRRAKGFRGN